MHQPAVLAIAKAQATGRVPIVSTFLTSTELHAASCLEASDPVYGHAVFGLSRPVYSALRIFACGIEEIDARKDNEEAAEERNRVDDV